MSTITFPSIKPFKNILFRNKPSSSALPLLSGMFVRRQRKHLLIRTTDLGTYAEIDIKLPVSGKKESAVIEGLKRSHFNSYEMTKLEVFNETVKWNGVELQKFPDSDDYPSFITDEHMQAVDFPVPEKLFWTLLKATKVVSTDKTRRLSLTGVFVGRENKEFHICSTDGHRLYQAKPEGIDSDNNFIIPAKTIKQIELMRKKFENVKLSVVSLDSDVTESDYRYILATGKEPKFPKGYSGSRDIVCRIYSKIIDEKYPEIERVIPDTDGCELITAKTKDVLSKLKEISKLDDLSKTHVIEFDGSGKYFVQNIEHDTEKYFAQKTEHDTKIGGIFPVKAPFRIGLNVNYLIDIVSMIDTEEFTWLFTSPTGPMALKPKYDHPEDVKELWLLMPVRLADEDG